MLEIIRQRERVESIDHEHVFEGPGGCGFRFDCDEDGNVDEAKMFPAGLANYKKCVAGEMEGYENHGIQQVESHYYESAIGKCECGGRVVLNNDENDCPKCGHLYNMFGQGLKAHDDPTRNWDMDPAMEREAEDYERMENDMFSQDW